MIARSAGCPPLPDRGSAPTHRVPGAGRAARAASRRVVSDPLPGVGASGLLLERL